MSTKSTPTVSSTGLMKEILYYIDAVMVNRLVEVNAMPPKVETALDALDAAVIAELEATS